MILANFDFVVSHLKIHPAFHLNTLKVLRVHCSQKEKSIKSLLAFVIRVLTLARKKIKWLAAEHLDVQTEQTRILIQ